MEDRITPSSFSVINTDNSGAGSLRDAITQANATPGNDDITFGVTGTITLDSALPNILDANATASGTGGTGTTVGTLTITGPGASSLTISGNSGNFSVFSIESGGDLTVTGMTVSGANFTSGNGGAFNNSGTLAISNSTLSGNTADRGGGIRNIGTLAVTDSTLSGNSANYAGAIDNSFGTVTVSNSTLSGNSAKYAGGGINSLNGTVTISNSTLSGNSAKYAAGGINNVNSTLTVTNSTLSDNSVNSSTSVGGGIANSGTATVTNSTLSGNSANSGGGFFNANGGTFTVANSTLSGNSANKGGGIYNAKLGTLAVTDSTLSGNSAKYGGGLNNYGTVTVTNSTLSGNSANHGGGLVNGDSGTLTVTNSTLSGNSATTGNGGGLYNNYGIVTLTNATLSGNSATKGGGIRSRTIEAGSPNGSLSIANTIIANSTGGDYSSTGDTILVNTNNLCEDGSLPAGTNNKTGDPLLGPLQDNGGPTFTMALLTGSPAIDAGDVTISNGPPVSGLDQRGFNRTTSDIGAYAFGIQVTTTADTVDSGDAVTSLREAITLANTTPGDDQISFAFASGTSPFTIALGLALPTILDANTAITGGTVGTLTINGLGASSLIISGNNGDSLRDFRIFNIESGGDLTISGVTVSGARSGGDGGAINNDGTLALYNSTLSGNFAISGNGGGVANYGTLTVSDSTFSGNYANGYGGAINNDGTVTISNSTLSGNSTGNEGGAIYNDEGATVTISNSTLSGNSTPNGNGGAIHNYYGTVTLANSTISGNSSEYGGGIFNYEGTVTVTNSTLSGNSADDEGGGIYNYEGTVNIANTIIANSIGGDFEGAAPLLNFGNLVEDGSITGAITGDPLLGPLQDNGGPTFTMALGVGSSAIGAGNAAISNAPPINALDQRGYARSSTTPSIGAFEYYEAPTVTSVAPGSGPLAGGTTITITGTNFINGPTTVSIDGVAATNVVVDSSTSITATTPAGALGAASVVVISAGGANSANNFFTYVTTTTTNLSSSPNPSVFGQSVTFTATVTSPDGTPIGSVTFKNGADTIGTGSLNGSGVATLSINSLAVGTASITAVYDGDSGFVTSTSAPVSQVVNPSSSAPLVIGSAPPNGNDPNNPGNSVNLYDPVTGQPTGVAVPFPGFMGEIRVASGDFNNDGVAEIVAAAGPGGGPAIAIMDSTTGAVLQAFFAYDPAFTGGVYVAVQDTNGDGVVDLVTGAGAGGGPHVKVFNGANLQELASFFAYAETFSGGVSVAAADINGDNILDIVTGAGPGGGPHVKVFDGATQTVLSQWYAYPVDFTGGVFVGMGDIGSDGNFEVVTGAGSGGGPVVAVFNPFTGELQSQFLAYAQEFSGGVRVGTSDATGDGIADLITGAGPGGSPHVKAFSYPELDLLFEFFSGPVDNTEGVFVS